MKIAVDAMGGDFAPRSIVEGTLKAARTHPDIQIVLVGPKERIQGELSRHKFSPSNITTLDAPEIISMGESPVEAIRKKKTSSIVMMAELAKRGEIDAMFSAGNTGAVVIANILKLRNLPGVDRPGIATPMPTPQGTFVLIDAGATVDCRPIHLLHFAVMGRIYAEYILKYPNPRVGLMNVGAEETKGNNFSKEVFNLLGEHDVNFIGNIEGRDLFSGRCEVIVCDGFIGNVVLKVAEGTAGVLKKFLKQVLTKNLIRRLGALLSLGAYRDLREIADHEEYGGAPLLGVNGTCIIGHGSSSSKAVENAIRVAKDFISCDVNRHIVEVLKTFSGKEDQR